MFRYMQVETQAICDVEKERSYEESTSLCFCKDSTACSRRSLKTKMDERHATHKFVDCER